MKLVKESISFQRTKNPKSTLMGWRIGQICAIRKPISEGTLLVKVKIYAGETTPEHPVYDTFLYTLGRIVELEHAGNSFLFELNKHFRENRQAFGKTISNESELSYLTKEEIKEVERSLNLPQQERWIQLFKEKTGITPFF